MNTKFGIITGSVIAMLLLAGAGVTAQWWLVLGVPLRAIDPVVFWLPGAMAALLGLLFARVLIVCKVLEREVASKQAQGNELESQGDALRRVNQDLSSFAHALVHDLRGPICVVRGFSEELLELDSYDRTVCQDRLTRIHRAARRMDTILSGLMRLCSVHRRAMSLTRVDVSEMVGEIADSLSEADPESGIEVQVQAGMAVEADQSMLEIALTNLLSNAWKFSRGRPAPVIRVWQGDDGVIQVEDKGVGFDPQLGVDLFEPFQRCHAKDAFEGSGIGLSTVRRVVERHGGRVWADGRPGEGATFYLQLTGAGLKSDGPAFPGRGCD